MTTKLNRATILSLGDQKPFAEAAKEAGLRTKDFVTIYRNFGGTRRGGISRRQPPSKTDLVTAFKKMTNKQVADHFKVGYKTLIRWLKHYNLQQHVFTNDMLSLSDAARELKVSRMTLSNWYRKGEIPGAVKVNETRVMVPRATISMLILLHGSQE
jgi:hypothetical protein